MVVAAAQAPGTAARSRSGPPPFHWGAPPPTSPPHPSSPAPAAARPAEEAVERFGRHGEKVAYGDASRFKGGGQKEGHFPGLPTTDTNAAGGHASGAKTP